MVFHILSQCYASIQYKAPLPPQPMGAREEAFLRRLNGVLENATKTSLYEMYHYLCEF